MSNSIEPTAQKKKRTEIMQIITASIADNKSLYINNDGIPHIIDSNSDMLTIKDDNGNEVKLKDHQIDMLLKILMKQIRGEEICDVLAETGIRTNNTTLCKIINEYSDIKNSGSKEIAASIIRKYCSE